jgi:hypothetical protein
MFNGKRSKAVKVDQRYVFPRDEKRDNVEVALCYRKAN